MADLRALVEGLGYKDVRTLLNSGNIVFTADASVRGDPGARIEKGMTARLGVVSRVTVLSAVELATVVRNNPLAKVANNPSRLLVTVLTNPADRDHLKQLAGQDWKQEAFAIGARVGYLWCPRGQLDSPLAAAVSRALGDGATTRNWATITKLHALAGGGV